MQVASATSPSRQRGYQRRRPARCALYRVIDEHYEQVLAEAHEHGAGYPAFVRKEFERYLRCGRLRGGFSRLVCKSCGFNHLLAFSCKGRLCPSCANRRMEQTAAYLDAKVLPDVGYRQWTLSLPWRIRFEVGTDAKLCSAVLRVMVRRLFRWQRRAARRAGISEPLCGSVTFIHRFNSQLLLSPHFHVVVPDGVFFVGDDAKLDFLRCEPPTDDEVEHLLRDIGRSIERLVQTARDARVDDDDTDALGRSLAEAASRARRRAWHQSTVAPPRSRPRCCGQDGYSLDALVAVRAGDRRALRRLLRYGARAPLAATRVSLTKKGTVVYNLRKPTAQGRTQLEMTPQQFIRRLAVLTPPPWMNLIRFHGVFASASGHRQAIAERVAAQSDPADDPFTCPPLHKNGDTSSNDASDQTPPPPPRHVRIAWSELLRTSFGDPLVCPRCQGPMRLVAVIKDPKVIDAILAHPHHRDADTDFQSGPDPPQRQLDLEPQLSLL